MNYFSGGRFRSNVLLGFAAVCLLTFGATGLRADPVSILTVTGSSAGTLDIFSFVGPEGDRGVWWGVSFALNTTHTNVAITPTLGYDPASGNFQGAAYLTTALPVNNSAAVIASNAFGFSSGNGTPVPVTVLSGLTLSPGTYYFLLAAPLSCCNAFSGVAHWPDLSSPAVIAGPGVTAGSFWFAGGGGVDPVNAPVGFWQLDSNTIHAPIQITGSPVPEPGTLGLLALGLAAFAGLRRR